VRINLLKKKGNLTFFILGDFSKESVGLFCSFGRAGGMVFTSARTGVGNHDISACVLQSSEN